MNDEMVINDYAQALSKFSALVNAKTGIIRSVEVVKISENDPMVFLATAEPCDTTPLTGLAAANRGAACSATQERAIVRACGESVERYCSAFFNVHALLLASEQEMARTGQRYVSVHDIYPFGQWQYADPQFPYQPTNRTRQQRWVQGTSLLTGEAVWLPASCVYVPYLFDVAVEPFTHMPISTGLAAGPSRSNCIRKGIMEILERDALMITWYARLPAPRIDPTSCRGISDEIDQLLAAARSSGSHWHLNLLTLDVDVPVICAALINPTGRPMTSFGISADLDPSRALLLALEEALLTRMLLNRSQELLRQPDYMHERLDTLRDHLLAHATLPALRQSLSFLTQSSREIQFEELVTDAKNKHAVVEKRLATVAPDVIWIDVTTPEIHDCGFHVVRTVIPGMQPLDNDHRYRYLGGQRLLSVPVKLGYPALTIAELNSDPHPFP